MNARTGLFTLKTADGKREKWRETHDREVFLPFTFAVNVMLNLSIVTMQVPKTNQKLRVLTRQTLWQGPEANQKLSSV